MWCSVWISAETPLQHLQASCIRKSDCVPVTWRARSSALASLRRLSGVLARLLSLPCVGCLACSLVCSRSLVAVVRRGHSSALAPYLRLIGHLLNTFSQSLTHARPFRETYGSLVLPIGFVWAYLRMRMHFHVFVCMRRACACVCAHF
jgi:ferredoxin